MLTGQISLIRCFTWADPVNRWVWCWCRLHSVTSTNHTCAFKFIIHCLKSTWPLYLHLPLPPIDIISGGRGAIHQGAPRQMTWLKSFRPGWRPDFRPGWLKISINFINTAHKQTELCATKCKSRFEFYIRSLHFVHTKYIYLLILDIGVNDLPYDLADMEVTWLSWRPGAATGHHPSGGNCLEHRRTIIIDSSVLRCVSQLYTLISTHVKCLTGVY